MEITVVGLVTTMREAKIVAQELTTVCRCEPSDISLMIRKGDNGSRSRAGKFIGGGLTGALLGAVIGAIAGFFANESGITVPGLETWMAAGPVRLILDCAGVGAGVGALVGAVIGLESRNEETDYGRGARRAGVLITLHARNNEEAHCALTVMRRGGVMDIDKRTSEWSKQDWNSRAVPTEPTLRPEPEIAASIVPESVRNPNEPRSVQPTATAVPAAGRQPASTPGAAVTSKEAWITRTYVATYFGPERRKAANQPYSGAERRHAA